MKKKIQDRKFFYPIIYLLLAVISFLPPITTRHYSPRETQEVIFQVLQNAIAPDTAKWGWVFHAGTLFIILSIALEWRSKDTLLPVYFGLNYFVIGCVQSTAVTPDYGSVVLPGVLIANLLLGILWISAIGSYLLQTSFRDVPRWRWYLLPLALLAFWAPFQFSNGVITPDFNPLLLFTSADYGLSYCFLSTVFLYLLILFHPNIPKFAFRVTAFNGLLYGLYNLTHWLDKDTVWLGVVHLPLLALSVIALVLSTRMEEVSPKK